LGELAFAAKVSHVPSIYLGEQPGHEGVHASLREGLVRLGEAAREARVETFVVFDSHWINTIGYHVNLAARHKGVFTSHEIPHFIHDMPYDYLGDPELAQAIVDNANAAGLSTRGHDYRSMDLEYATLLPMRYMNRDRSIRVVPVGQNANTTWQENRRFGEAVRRAIEASPRRVGLLASGSMSHRFWPNEVAPSRLLEVSSAFNRQTDEHVLTQWREGRWAEFLAFLPTYLEVCAGEVNMSDTVMLFGALGWDGYRGRGEQYGDYEGSSGTGQVNVRFSVDGLGAVRAASAVAESVARRA
jgi:3,4-dihydroxyphenylacetate 2,3-dioxygenase